MKSYHSIIFLLILLCVAPVLAQVSTCPDIVQSALQTLDEYCAVAARNQACLGNIRLDVTAQPEVVDFHFEDVGDIENVEDIESLRLYPMDEDEATWGVAMMRLQANLPDTLPGQNVTFLLFGDVELVNAGGDTPMQAMYLTTGIGDASCNEAPDSGLLVQTPNGAGQISFTINGVDINAGSTVVFSASPGEQMRVNTLEGAATFYVDDEAYPVIEGTYVETDLDEDFAPQGDPDDPEPYNLENFDWLPDEILGQEIEVEDPLTEDEIEELLELIEEGRPLCDQDVDTFLPTCEHLPPEFGGSECTFDPIAEPDLPFCQLEMLSGEGDSDGDGYFDSQDYCPFIGDIVGTGVDELGCPYLSPDDDIDLDGFPNSHDYCLYIGDIYGMGVDEFGCPYLPPDEDADFDGWLNAYDACPFDGDIYGAGVDEFGCPYLSPDEDTDFDGFLNSHDACPLDGDVYGEGLDEIGCPYLPADGDMDYDGILNSQDYCPFEGNLYGEGVDELGCPYIPPDADTDFDGFVNSQDSCPFDGDIYGLGIDEFGCPYLPEDGDTDGDGFVNSQDSCPYEGDIYGYGIDGTGCPIPPPAVDSDGDGYADGVDSCPFEGDIYGYGVDGAGCPIPPPPVDSDGDGYADNADSCPFEGDIYGYGVDGTGCPIPP